MQNKPIIGRYARILLDDWFKRSFGQENSKRLLQLFLEALIPEHRIVELTYANTEHTNPSEGKKDVRIDVYFIGIMDFSYHGGSSTFSSSCPTA